jgi:hypothetical protein
MIRILVLSIFIFAYGNVPLIPSLRSLIERISLRGKLSSPHFQKKKKKKFIRRMPVYITGLFPVLIMQIRMAVLENVQTVLKLQPGGILSPCAIRVIVTTISEIYRPSHMPYSIV